MTKNFKLMPEDFVELVPPMGGCFATDKITVDGMTVGFMYREQSDEPLDSGWRFFSGTESQEHVNEPNNTMIYEVNTIANYDRAIIPYLGLPYGTELERVEGTDKFEIISADHRKYCFDAMVADEQILNTNNSILL